MIIFALLAALGLLISVAANVSTFFGVEPLHRWGYVWLLHLGFPEICDWTPHNKRAHGPKRR
jgi:hypothetical protein